MKIDILYKDGDVLIINKPAGILVHGVYGRDGAKHTEETLVDWLLEHYPEIEGVGDVLSGGTIERAGIVHRLDRETSGVMVIAKNQDAFRFLKNQFQSREVKKTYEALVWGRLKNKSGVIDKPISIKGGSVKRTVFKGKMTREAVTRYEVVKEFRGGDGMTLLKVIPKTGRTHQVRVHLNSIGHPVVGDKIYGKKKIPEKLERHFLHAESLELVLPSRKNIKVTTDLPNELESFLRGLSAAD